MSQFFPEDMPPVVNQTIARVRRRLSYPGEILVRVGSRVEPDDVIGRALVPGPAEKINLARALSVAPHQIRSIMRKPQGSQVAAGELLARVGVIGRRSCHSPVAGTITMVDDVTGYVAIAPEPQPLELRANVRGLVMEVDERSATIETPSRIAYGIAGIGEDRFGVLRLVPSDPGEIIDEGQIKDNYTYAIMIGGAGITAAALRKAVQLQVRGVIVGGIDAQELMSFMGDHAGALFKTGHGTWSFPASEGYDPGLTLMLTEGFGVRPMSQPIFELLASLDQQEALLQGHTQLRSPLLRPRLVVPLTRSRATGELKLPQPPLASGSPVRLLDEQHLGQVATLVSLSSIPELLPSGSRGLAAHVQLATGERMVLARSAVEALSR